MFAHFTKTFDDLFCALMILLLIKSHWLKSFIYQRVFLYRGITSSATSKPKMFNSRKLLWVLSVSHRHLHKGPVGPERKSESSWVNQGLSNVVSPEKNIISSLQWAPVSLCKPWVAIKRVCSLRQVS